MLKLLLYTNYKIGYVSRTHTNTTVAFINISKCVLYPKPTREK